MLVSDVESTKLSGYAEAHGFTTGSEIHRPVVWRRNAALHLILLVSDKMGGQQLLIPEGKLSLTTAALTLCISCYISV